MEGFMRDVLEAYGTPAEEAAVCADVLIESDKRGIDSHGIGRLKPIYCDRMDQGILKPFVPLEIISESDTTALVDGGLGLGLYIGPKCMQMAIDKAKKHGVGFVAVQNSTHYGIAGYYATQAADAGCVGWSGTNARPSIAPTFGVEPMMGTNPLCFGIPTDDGFPFCIDCATRCPNPLIPCPALERTQFNSTPLKLNQLKIYLPPDCHLQRSVNQRGKIERYAREGKDTPKGCVVDNEGIERTDTEGILRDMQLGKCALTPVGGAGDDLGGYKGYGWALTVELLATAFQSGPFGEDVCGIDRATGAKKPMPLGHYFLAIDIEKVSFSVFLFLFFIPQCRHHHSLFVSRLAFRSLLSSLLSSRDFHHLRLSLWRHSRRIPRNFSTPCEHPRNLHWAQAKSGLPAS
jgi:LDH2 family malate/lactate/ureidoglycolate dehydrogenase